MASEIQVNQQDQARILGKLERLGRFGGRVVAQEINRAATQLRTEATRAVKGELSALNVGTIRRRFTIRKGSASRPEAEVAVSHRPINLARFRARQTRKGLSVAVKGSRELIRHAFLIPARFGQGETTTIAVWRPKRGSTRVGRLPVKSLLTSSVRDVFQNHRDRVLSQSGERLLERLHQRLDAELAKRGA